MQEEKRKLKDTFKNFSDEELFEHLKMLISTKDTNDPEEFKKIEELFHSLDTDYLYKILTFQSIKGGLVREDSSRAYELLKMSIENNAKNVVKLLYTHFEPCEINKIEYTKFFHDLRPKETKYLPSDLEILASCAETHQDPVGMAKVLLSYKELKNIKLPMKCFSTSNSQQFNEFSQYLKEYIKPENRSKQLENQLEKLEIYIEGTI